MNSKERVLTAFEHRKPDRIPLWYGASSGLTEKIMKRCGMPNVIVMYDEAFEYGRYQPDERGKMFGKD